MEQNKEFEKLTKGFCEAEGLENGQWITFIDDHQQPEKFIDMLSSFLSYAIEQGVMCDYKQSQKTLLKTIELHELEIEGLKNRIAEQPKTDKLTLQECKDRVAKKNGYRSWQHMCNSSFNDIPGEYAFNEVSEMYADQYRQNQIIAEPEKWVSVKEDLKFAFTAGIICERERNFNEKINPIYFDEWFDTYDYSSRYILSNEKWIDVNKELPGSSGKVLIYGAYTKDCKRSVMEASYVKRGNRKNFHGFYVNNIKSKNITHWQPLPPAPSEANTAKQVTDEEIEKEAETWVKPLYWIEGAKWMRDKLTRK